MKKRTKTKGDSSITFVWNTELDVPKVAYDNITGKNVNDVFSLAAENLLLSDREYYPVLVAQLNKMYEFMYSENQTIN